MCAQTIRTFFAFEFGACFKDEIGSVIRSLNPQQAKVKWVDASKVHLTIHFFGDLSEQEIKDVTVCSHLLSNRTKPMNVVLNGVGAFPSLRNPRVIWIGLKGEVKELISFKAEYDSFLMEKGFMVDKKRFHPHITIGRVKDLRSDLDLIEKMQSYSLSDQKVISINSATLFKSVLTSHGPEYSVIQTFPFKERRA